MMSQFNNTEILTKGGDAISIRNPATIQSAFLSPSPTDEKSFFNVRSVSNSTPKPKIEKKHQKRHVLASLPNIKLRDVLESKTKKPISFSEFRTFITAEHDQDNLDFWIEVEAYRTSYYKNAVGQENSKNRQQILAIHREWSMKLVDQYIRNNSPLELNFPSSIKAEVIKGTFLRVRNFTLI